jgi:hypothetical protein
MGRGGRSVVSVRTSYRTRARLGITPSKTCQFCKTTGLMWSKTSVGWRLRDPRTKELHLCQKRLAKERAGANARAQT